LSSEHEGSDEDLEARQSESESESDSDDSTGGNEASELLTPNVQIETDSLGDELNMDIHAPVTDCTESDDLSSQTALVSSYINVDLFQKQMIKFNKPG